MCCVTACAYPPPLAKTLVLAVALPFASALAFAVARSRADAPMPLPLPLPKDVAFGNEQCLRYKHTAVQGYA